MMLLEEKLAGYCGEASLFVPEPPPGPLPAEVTNTMPAVAASATAAPNADEYSVVVHELLITTMLRPARFKAIT
jgi:hypothetical protein